MTGAKEPSVPSVSAGRIAKRRRPHQVLVRLDDHEQADLERFAQLHGMTLAALLRSSALYVQTTTELQESR